jgi:hypothetical protein
MIGRRAAAKSDRPASSLRQLVLARSSKNSGASCVLWCCSYIQHRSGKTPIGLAAALGEAKSMTRLTHFALGAVVAAMLTGPAAWADAQKAVQTNAPAFGIYTSAAPSLPSVTGAVRAVLVRLF